jgi:mRNA interferase MazF
MNLRRGDLITVAVSGDYGKPRPAVVVQTDTTPADHSSVIICQLTSTIEDHPRFRIDVEPTEANGLRRLSQIMADKPTTIHVDRAGPKIGRLRLSEMRRLDRALMFILGLTD